MALINCPECSKEISEIANSCPNCGYPINDDSVNEISKSSMNLDEISPSEPFVETLKTNSKLSKKALLFIVIAGISIFAIVTAVILIMNGTPKQADTVYNTNLDIEISLGMDKVQIDKLLGESVVYDSISAYDDYGIAVSFRDEKANMIIITSNEWESFGGIKVSDPISKLTDQFGNLVGGVYMFDENSKITDEKAKVNSVITYSIENDAISSYAVISNK